MIRPKVKIEASADTRDLNLAVELFDRWTGFGYDRTHDLSTLAHFADMRGWADLAATFRRHAGKAAKS